MERSYCMMLCCCSQKQVDRALYALKSSQAVSELTLDTVLRALSRHVTVAECAVRGHLTVELDLMVLVVPVRPEPSPLQVLTLPVLLVELHKAVTTTAYILSFPTFSIGHTTKLPSPNMEWPNCYMIKMED